jgi:radical SAM family protein
VSVVGTRTVFHLLLVKPTHYDDDGYPIQWWRSAIPANTLAAVYGIAEDARARQVLGPAVDIRIHAIDECNKRVSCEGLIRTVLRDGGHGLLALVGVQSNQFPRAIDIARPFRAAGVPVCIGGFHVSGCLAMLPEMPEEMRAAQALGISFFAGEAEGGRLDQVLRDALAGRLRPTYNWLAEMPDLRGSPIPILPARQVRRTMGFYSSFDLGRGCPFQCSFCTIINVQGRVSRFRTADDLEAIVRANHAIGIDGFFITDDNLARNRNWEACFDRLIQLREAEGLCVNLQIQVDTLCHRVPRFIDKAVAAGVDQVFIGLENINPDNLAAARKKQNRITEYRDMLLAWKAHPVVITAGYIIGFPNDTRDSVAHDIEVIKRELPLDVMYFTYLTPLPGCEDHKRLLNEQVWMDPDLNKYDLDHRVTHHPLMSDVDWEAAYEEAWQRFYTFEHMETVLKRMRALGSRKGIETLRRLAVHRLFPRIYGIHPWEGGIARIRHRRDRRPTMKRENPFVFYPRYMVQSIIENFGVISAHLRLLFILIRARRDERNHVYCDGAISRDAPEQDLALYSETRGGKKALERALEQRSQSAWRERVM